MFKVKCFFEGGLVLQKPDAGAPLQYAATASFLSKLYSDYLQLLQRTSGGCGDETFSSEKLQDFAASQVQRSRLFKDVKF